MLKGTILRITPGGPLAEALNAKAHAALPREPGRSSTRRRKKRVEMLSPGSRAAYELNWAETAKSEWEQDCEYTISGRPADCLMGNNSLTDNLLLQTIDPMLGLFKHAIRQQFPDLDPDLLDLLGIEHCTMSHVEPLYVFNFLSETAAIDAFHQLLAHAKVMKDGVEILYNSSKKTVTHFPPMVHTSDDQRWAFSIDLPFGTATVKLARSWDDCPRSFCFADDISTRKELRSLLRCMLVVTVQVDLEKFSFDGHTLPQKPALWTRDNLKRDPYQLIWDAFRFDTWLNWPLITDESQVDWERLNDDEQEVMRAYLNPQTDDLRQLPVLQRDKAPAKFRSALINKAFAVISIPWAILRHNHSKALGPVLEYANRFQPGQHALLAPYVLSIHTIKEASMKLANALSIVGKGKR